MNALHDAQTALDQRSYSAVATDPWAALEALVAWAKDREAACNEEKRAAYEKQLDAEDLARLRAEEGRQIQEKYDRALADLQAAGNTITELRARIAEWETSK